jgi:hypothetical protein
MSLNHFKSLAITPVPASLYNVPALFTLISSPSYYNYTIVADRIIISMVYSIECSNPSSFELSIDVPLPTGIKRYIVGEPDTNSSSVIGKANGTPQFLANGTNSGINTDKMVLKFRSTAQATAGQQYDVVINCSCRLATSAAQIA